MARDQFEITLANNQWTQITNADVTVISFQNLSGELYIRATNGGAVGQTPSSDERGWFYAEGKGELNKDMADLFKLVGANRVWARSATDTNAIIQVDHA